MNKDTGVGTGESRRLCDQKHMICPTCQREFHREETKFPPFCSKQCQLIDLGRWLNDEFTIPGDPTTGADLEPDDGDK